MESIQARRGGGKGVKQKRGGVEMEGGERVCREFGKRNSEEKRRENFLACCFPCCLRRRKVVVAASVGSVARRGGPLFGIKGK